MFAVHPLNFTDYQQSLDIDNLHVHDATNKKGDENAYLGRHSN
jgi:hypothetical protein